VIVHVGIVGHVQREEMATKLYDEVGADFLSIDPGGLGCLANHLNVWRWHADSSCDFAVTLEDDAVPIGDFRHQLAAALAVAPTPLVSLYLGRGYIGDSRLSAWVRRAEAVDAHWLLGEWRVLHAVGLAVRWELVTSLTMALARRNRTPVDGAISQWARRDRHEVAYTMPSLVDHRDESSLVMRHRRAPRTAWRVGGHDQWTSASIPMN
jgi:GR25 family glycosyltransferase involved in LPS biosynthesis